MRKNYNIGLDIGTNSVGWSVTDTNYNLLKFKKKNMWGVRLFNSGETSENRRQYRSSRRRLKRRKERIYLLQNLLSYEVLSVDKVFFLRLKESYLHQEDRINNKNKSNLFVGREFTDKEYYNKYPTIYHLRKELIYSDKKMDIRLIYLALHHIIKYRGNFLYEGQNFESITGSIKDVLTELINILSTEDIVNISLSIEEIENAILDKNLSRLSKVDKLIQDNIENKACKNELKNIFNGFFGLTVDVSKIFKEIKFEEEIKFKFSDEDIEDKLELLETTLGEDYIIIELMQKVYNWALLGSILKGYDNLSEAMVFSYEKYKEELNIVKKIVNYYDRSLFLKLFKEKEIGANYSSYINNRNKALDNKGSKTVKSEFYNEIETLIKNNIKDNKFIEEKNYILNEIKKDSLLLPQNITDNSAIPYQLNEIELKKILQNQGKYYNGLRENTEKILSLLTFRVPYYVGPLNNVSSFSWFERLEGKDNEKIYPWNFDEIVDRNASAEKFIKRMTNKCSYLIQEDVIPKNSLLYTEYMFYNEINKLRINGEFLDKRQKEDLKNKVFLQKKTVNEKDILNWCKNSQLFNTNEYTITGLQEDKKASATLTPFIDFKRIVGEINNSNIKMVEQIIYWLTIFEDKGILKEKIKSKYGENKILSDYQITEICKLRYKGWSRLSEKLLKGIYVVDSTGRKNTIISKLKETNYNFMQIINNDKLGFKEKIKEESKLIDTNVIGYDNLVKDLQGSPAIKRGIWQSIKIIEEIISIMKGYPENIFIEFAREDQASKRTSTKKNRLLKIYEEVEDCQEVLKLLKDKKTIIQNKRQQLYFIQQGKCMYTGDKLEYDQLHLYEEDHIICQSLIKDDSIDNLVLVKKKMNQDRGNNVMPRQFVSDPKIIAWWELLYSKNLISAKKYRNLNKLNLSEIEEQGFIQRQLVETRQISKHVANILASCYEKEGTKVVTIKAGLVDNFRKQFEIYKVREINDYHHAKDAFITTVLGEYLLQKYPKLESEFIYDEYKKYKKDIKVKNKYGFIIGSMNKTSVNEDGVIVWDKDESIRCIKRQLNYKDCFITKKVEENKGELFKGTIYKKIDKDKKVSAPIPIRKGLDVKKYGYYTGENTAYYAIIEYLKGKKNVKLLVSIPIRFANMIKNDNEKLKDYLEKEKGYKSVHIIKSNILKYQLFKNENGYFYLVGDGEWQNATQCILSKEYEMLCYRISDNKLANEITDEELIKFYDYFKLKVENHFSIFKSVINTLQKNKEKFIELSKENKISIVKELLKLTRSNAEYPNLKAIDGSDRQGRLTKKSMNIDNTTFIYQSTTGLFVREERY